tara:strand:- start:2807 stop:3517 length:711 start_codon:yes stop_codon:yes gene_type:complete
MRVHFLALSLMLSGAAFPQLLLASQAADASHGKAPQGADSPKLQAPSGRYEMDPNHSYVGFSVKHLGVSNYQGRFTDVRMQLELVPDNLSASSVQARINADSIAADYSGDFKAKHPESAFASWPQTLARSEQFFNSKKYPWIEFHSTQIEEDASGELLISGNLTLLGQTHPVRLTAKLVGSMAKHPFTGAGVIGFSAQGSFERSRFGMTHLVETGAVGDEVRIVFEGEFKQVKAVN